MSGKLTLTILEAKELANESDVEVYCEVDIVGSKAVR
jgi:hypothetical protein